MPYLFNSTSTGTTQLRPRKATDAMQQASMPTDCNHRAAWICSCDLLSKPFPTIYDIHINLPLGLGGGDLLALRTSGPWEAGMAPWKALHSPNQPNSAASSNIQYEAFLTSDRVGYSIP